MARCPVCKRRHPGTGRCARCRGTTTERGYGTQWQRLSRAVLADWRDRNGDWCPGYQVDPHTVEWPNVLTTDHTTAMMRAGRAVPDPDHVSVLCRECNSRKLDKG